MTTPVQVKAPEHGQWCVLKDGLYWLRQRLPFDLDHINVYALAATDGWSAVDTGINSGSSKKTWRAFQKDAMGDVAPTRLICTHLHPDHVGLAGWFAHELGAPLFMTRAEYLQCRILVADTGRPAPDEGVSFYRAAGYSQVQLDKYRADFGGFGRIVAPLPESYRRLRAGMVLEVGGRTWRVVVGSGHSPEHACLFNETDNIMLSGDQLLPKISSNVSVWPTEPLNDPLRDWLDSCAHLLEVIDDETLVCPAHGLPFTGGPARLRQLIASHQRKLDFLLERLDAPMRAVDVADYLFPTAEPKQSILAVGETLAHLNYLIEAGKVIRSREEQVDIYTRAGSR